MVISFVVVSLLMGQFSWLPGLPTIESLDAWFVDSEPRGKRLRDYELAFLVGSKGTAELLANRHSSAVQLKSASVTQIDHEKQYMEIDGRRVLVKRFKYTPETETGTKLPDDFVGVMLPPTRMQVTAD